MDRIMLRPLSCLAVLLFAQNVACASNPPTTIIANDNRSPAGELRGGKLILTLELGEGLWHPEGEDGRAIAVYAFGEMGRTLQNPGPLIRVQQGTEIQITLHNALPVAATVHGLHERPGADGDFLTLQPGATQDIHFNAGLPGTYYYWATTSGSSVSQRRPIETQLSGAFIVDPRGSVAADRIFVIGVWYKELPFRAAAPQLATINGKSWPYTERLTLQIGETVRWRWLNPTVINHGMHLHGFFYQVLGAGNGERYESYSEGKKRSVVTQYIDRGETFDMTWIPERPGRWLFHCHMMMHMMPPDWPMLEDVEGPTASASPAAGYSHPADADQAGMGGLVLGITVPGDPKMATPAAWHAQRRLQLVIDEHDGSRPHYALQLREPGEEKSQPAAHNNPDLIGPPIVITRGQPVEIEVMNHSKEPTAIHWHGIELESYYDGVPGWTGTGEHITPAIQSGQSFVARMTPPRAGTFIYHTHWHDQEQFENGLYGPLLVMPPGQRFDPASDKVFLFSAGTFEPFGEMMLINGNAQPSPLKLISGTKYRFRLINISANNVGMTVSLRKAGIPVEWRVISKDGAELSPAAATTQKAEMRITVGETYDVQYQSDTPQELSLEIYIPGPKLRVTQALVFDPGPRPN